MTTETAQTEPTFLEELAERADDDLKQAVANWLKDAAHRLSK